MLSRLSATREFKFLEALQLRGLPVPRAIGHSRHAVVMELVDGFPLYQVQELDDPLKLCGRLGGLVLELASHGVIHCDFNEFNILVKPSEEPVIIDFPQMVSISHRDARRYFERDVECLRRFFGRRFCLENEEMDEVLPSFEDIKREGEMDQETGASGYQKSLIETFEDDPEDGQQSEDEDEESPEDEPAVLTGDPDSSAPPAPASSQLLLHKTDQVPQLVEDIDDLSVDDALDAFDSVSVSTTTSTIAPEAARARVRQALKKRAAAARRPPRAKGEACLVNRSRRDALATVKESTTPGGFWE